MLLKDWIIKTGPKKTAKLLGVAVTTVSNWRVNHGLPRPRIMVRINKITNGKVSYKEMIENAAAQK